MPASSKLIFACEIRPVRSSRSVRSRATTCDTFATESFGKPVIPAVNSTFPGASAHRKLLVSGTQTAVASRLRFNASPWTMTTGRRNPGPEPAGSGSSAQHTSPWEITIRRDRAPAGLPRRGRRHRSRQPRRIRGSSCRLSRHAHGAQDIRRAPPHTLRFAIFALAKPGVLRVRKCRRESILLFSYRQYNRFMRPAVKWLRA